MIEKGVNLLIQVAKKSLIAAQFAQDSNNVIKEGNLQHIGSKLDDQMMVSMASDLERMLGSADRMQYPSTQQYPNIPHELYTDEIARKALHEAKSIFERAHILINGV